MNLTAENITTESVLAANCHVLAMALNSDEMSFDKWFSGIVAAVLSLPVATLNLLVIYVIIKTPSLHIPSNVVLCSLAISDFLTGLIHLPLLAYISFQIENLGCPTILLSVAFGYSLIITSVSGMMLVTTDRYIAIFHPYHYLRWFSNKLACYIAIGVVLFGFTIGSCSMATKGMSLFTRTLVVLIPAVLVWSVFVHLRSFLISRKIRTGDTSVSATQQQKTNKRVLTTVLLILLAMIVCYTPYFVQKILQSMFGITSSFWHDVGFVGRILIFANSGVNPLLYCWRLTLIKREIKKILKTLTSICYRKNDRIQP